MGGGSGGGTIILATVLEGGTLKLRGSASGGLLDPKSMVFSMFLEAICSYNRLVT